MEFLGLVVLKYPGQNANVSLCSTNLSEGKNNIKSYLYVIQFALPVNHIGLVSERSNFRDSLDMCPRRNKALINNDPGLHTPYQLYCKNGKKQAFLFSLNKMNENQRQCPCRETFNINVTVHPFN